MLVFTVIFVFVFENFVSFHHYWQIFVYHNGLHKVGVFVKSQLGNKSTLSLLVISQPINIGKKSTFNLLVSSQPNYIEVKIQPLIHWNYNKIDSYALVKSQLCIIKYRNQMVWPPPSLSCQYLLYMLLRYSIKPNESFSQKCDKDKLVESVHVFEKSHKWKVCTCHSWFQKDELCHHRKMVLEICKS